MPVTLTPFNSIEIASNESVDYYALNRSLFRLYDTMSTVTSTLTAPYSNLANVPYATENYPGFVTFTDRLSGQYDNKIISTNVISSYIDTVSLTASTPTYIDGNVQTDRKFYIPSGGGQLIDGLKIQYNYATILAAANSNNYYTVSLSSHVFSGTINFDTSNIYSKFTQTPHILINILDNKDNITTPKFGYKYTLSNETSAGFNYNLYIYKLASATTIKNKFYISWMAIGV